MEIEKGNFLLRKLTVTFVTTVFLSVLFVLFMFHGGFEFEYNRGNNFLGWFYVYAMYIGLIILIYGNAVSIAVEYLQSKFFQKHDWLYVFILGFFGMANGVLFQSRIAAIYGMIAAMLYGILDKWIYKRNTKGKRLKKFWLLPIGFLILCWLFLQVTSPPMPPFTKEDAVSHATSGEGSIIDEFPNAIGEWEGMLGDYHVIRETSVEEMGKETYLVTFTEHWEKGMEKGAWELSYKVERQSMTLKSSNGDMRPYDSIP